MAINAMTYVPIYMQATKPNRTGTMGGSFYAPRQKMYIVMQKPVNQYTSAGNFWMLYGPENNPRAVLTLVKSMLNSPVVNMYVRQENLGMEPLVLMELIPIDTEVRMV